MTLIERAEKAARRGTGWSYSDTVLREICNAGYGAIPHGALLGVSSVERITLENDVVVCRKGSEIVKQTPITDDTMRAHCLIAYAVETSKRGYRVGI